MKYQIKSKTGMFAFVVVFMMGLLSFLLQPQIASANTIGAEYAINLEGTSLEENETVVLIPNSNYFVCNPKHHKNDGSDNANGTCTTVAI